MCKYSAHMRVGGKQKTEKRWQVRRRCSIESKQLPEISEINEVSTIQKI
tara:strand:+ start:196 stop:342 length:147 start_codon:yes stop_codon:yes gene_type:complete